MDQTRSAPLMSVRDPADAGAWGAFVAPDEPLRTADLQHRRLGPEDTRDVVQEVFARPVTSGGMTGAPSIATPGAARFARWPTRRGRGKRPAAPSNPVLASRRSGRRPLLSGLSR